MGVSTEFADERRPTLPVVFLVVRDRHVSAGVTASSPTGPAATASSAEPSAQLPVKSPFRSCTSSATSSSLQ